MSPSTADAPKRDLSFFIEITDAFKASAASVQDGNLLQMRVAPFLDAMTMFLRIFDAFSNPFFSEVVKKDVVGNINVRPSLIPVAALATHAHTPIPCR